MCLSTYYKILILKIKNHNHFGNVTYLCSLLIVNDPQGTTNIYEVYCDAYSQARMTTGCP